MCSGARLGAVKTTLARLLAQELACPYKALSAVASGTVEIRKILDQARDHRRTAGTPTLFFIDEIHRFNRGQQDAFLPDLEQGSIILVGATTENPSFELNSALLSRCRVLVFERLALADLEQLLQRAERYLGRTLPLQADTRERLLSLADGDARTLLNMVETLRLVGDLSAPMEPKELPRYLERRAPLYDKTQDSHYNLISALHKSLRASDCQASLYWLARMLDGGETPHYIARRLLRFAYEDVGLADPDAGPRVEACWRYYERLGTPEGEIALFQAAIYLATAPKSNRVYAASKAALQHARRSAGLMPPRHFLNAPTRLMKQLGYGENYQYDHDCADSVSGQACLPEQLEHQEYYHPTSYGFEREIHKRMDWWHKRRTEKRTQASPRKDARDNSKKNTEPTEK